jgi:hypothetical protein
MVQQGMADVVWGYDFDYLIVLARAWAGRTGPVEERKDVALIYASSFNGMADKVFSIKQLALGRAVVERQPAVLTPEPVANAKDVNVLLAFIAGHQKLPLADILMLCALAGCDYCKVQGLAIGGVVKAISAVQLDVPTLCESVDELRGNVFAKLVEFAHVGKGGAKKVTLELLVAAQQAMSLMYDHGLVYNTSDKCLTTITSALSGLTEADKKDLGVDDYAMFSPEKFETLQSGGLSLALLPHAQPLFQLDLPIDNLPHRLTADMVEGAVLPMPDPRDCTTGQLSAWLHTRKMQVTGDKDVLVQRVLGAQAGETRAGRVTVYCSAGKSLHDFTPPDTPSRRWDRGRDNLPPPHAPAWRWGHGAVMKCAAKLDSSASLVYLGIERLSLIEAEKRRKRNEARDRIFNTPFPQEIGYYRDAPLDANEAPLPPGQRRDIITSMVQGSYQDPYRVFAFYNVDTQLNIVVLVVRVVCTLGPLKVEADKQKRKAAKHPAAAPLPPASTSAGGGIQEPDASSGAPGPGTALPVGDGLSASVSGAGHACTTGCKASKNGRCLHASALLIAHEELTSDTKNPLLWQWWQVRISN